MLTQKYSGTLLTELQHHQSM